MPLLVPTPRGFTRADGRPALLYGGEVQYFRLRARDHDAAATHGIWADRLDRVVDAGMDYVTTYVPWDHHEREPGRFDFEGSRDLPRFLAMCHERGLLVHFKPGPLINSEWPHGPGTFGALPRWFIERHPEALARRRGGGFFHFHPLLPWMHTRQPSLLHPVFLEAVERWFAALAPIVTRFVREEPTIGLLQLDNETNLFFGDRFDVDFSEPMLASYRAFLRARHGTVDALNAAYGDTGWESFEEVLPPRRPPREPVENPAVADWFEAGQVAVADFLARLRAMWERLGIREPEDVCFTTNDSPHAARPVRHILLWDGARKNASGRAFLDLYPKMLPIGGAFLDQPFMVPYWARAFSLYDDLAPGGAPRGRACYAVEAQGGLFALPFGLRFGVKPEATRHMALQLLGHGCRALGFYILAEGLNADDTPYHFEAGIDWRGGERPRWAVLSEIGRRLVRPHGEALWRSEEVLSRVAVAIDGGPAWLAPAAGLADDLQALWGAGHAGLFGWLAMSGYDPDVVDLRRPELLGPEGLAGYAAIFLRNPGLLGEEAAEALLAYVRGGGTLVNVGRVGHLGDDGRPAFGALALLAGEAIGAREARVKRRLPGLPRARVRVTLPDGERLAVRAGRWWARLEPPGDATVIARVRTLLSAGAGDPVGFVRREGAGRIAHVGSPITDDLGTGAYYALDPDELAARRRLLRGLLAPTGERPLFAVEDPRLELWARRAPEEAGGGLFVFVVLGDRARTVTVRPADLARLGLRADARYEVTDLLAERVLATLEGEALARAGVGVPLRDWGATVLRVRALG